MCILAEGRLFTERVVSKKCRNVERKWEFYNIWNKCSLIFIKPPFTKTFLD